MKKSAFIIAVLLIVFSCGRRDPGSLVVEVPGGIAKASPELVFHPGGDGENFLDAARSRTAAKPGYVIAFDRVAGAQTECSATSRSLCYRFTWVDDVEHLLLFDPSEFGHGTMMVAQAGPTEVLASADGFFVYFRTSSEIVNIEVDHDGRTLLTFDGNCQTVALTAGLSTVSTEDARAYLLSDAGEDMFNLEHFVSIAAADQGR